MSEKPELPRIGKSFKQLHENFVEFKRLLRENPFNLKVSELLDLIDKGFEEQAMDHLKLITNLKTLFSTRPKADIPKDFLEKFPEGFWEGDVNEYERWLQKLETKIMEILNLE